MKVVVELQMDKISQQLLLTLTLAPSEQLVVQLRFPTVHIVLLGFTGLKFDFSASPYEILPTDLSFVFACTPTIHEGHSVLHFTARGERSFVILSLNCTSKCNDWIVCEEPDAVVVEDLVIERYIFVPCWDFPTIGTAEDNQLPLGSHLQTLGTSEIANIFYFSHSIQGRRGVDVKNNFLEDIVIVYKRDHFHLFKVFDLWILLLIF
ncbi:hypothetical protein L3X38_019978 [Prunus dulcis]|uniref:Uncharacterized protein n=1 Tax=Prunus dulcis TaxID=3755 RepID=A0AAD4ZCI2_PRUDU|nr:hypothetical protein L3X38_019978 [Prunus dulcis]